MEEAPEISALRDLIRWMNLFQPISFDLAKETRALHNFEWTGAVSDAEDARLHHEKHRPRAFDVSPPKGQFHGKEADQDLAWNVFFLRRLMQDWFSHCHSVPPGWADRICVLLRKRQMFDLEREFLAAFIRHYATPYTSASNTPLIARAFKIGAIT